METAPQRRARAGPVTPAGEPEPVAGNTAPGDAQPAEMTAPVPRAAVRPAEAPAGRPIGLERSESGLTPGTLLLTIFAAYVLFKIQIVILLLIAGILLATAIARPVEWLHRRRNIGRGQATLVMYAAILIGFGLLLYLLLPPVAAEARRLAQDFPTLRETWRQQLTGSNNALLRNAGIRLFQVLDTAGGAGTLLPTGIAIGVVQGIGGTVIALFSIFLIGFYWINEKPLIKRTVASLFRPGQRRRALRLWDEVEIKLGAWIRGQLILMAVVGAIATVAYSPLLLGLPFWLILGVIAGLTEAVPNVGPIIGAVPAVLMALTVDWKLALIVVVFVVVLQVAENAVLVPRIMRGTVGLTPLTIILAILAGGEFRGVVGALLAIPVAGAIQVILSDLLHERRKREADAMRQPPPSTSGGWFRRRVLRPNGAGGGPVERPTR